MLVTHGSTVLIRNIIFRVVHLGSPWTGGQRNVPTRSRKYFQRSFLQKKQIIVSPTAFRSRKVLLGFEKQTPDWYIDLGYQLIYRMFEPVVSKVKKLWREREKRKSSRTRICCQLDFEYRFDIYSIRARWI